MSGRCFFELRNKAQGNHQLSFDPEQAMRQAVVLHQQGNLDEAQRLYQAVLEVRPDHFDALHLLGLIRVSQNDREEGVRLIRKALRQRPDSVEAHYNLGVVLQEQKNLDEAMTCYQKALAIRPDFAAAHNNLGNVLREQKKTGEAIGCYEKALAIQPDYAEAHNNLGNALLEQGKTDEAIACYQKALAVKPDFADALHQLGNVFAGRKKLDDAIVCYRKAVAANPGHAVAHNNLGNALLEQGKCDEAVACYRRAIAVRPDYADALYNLGSALEDRKQFDEAIACYRGAISISPDHVNAFGMLLRAELSVCNWAETKRLGTQAYSRLAAGDFFIDPFVFIGISDSPLLQLECARKYVEDRFPGQPARVYQGTPYAHQKIRIAYLSADFHRHATAYLMAGLFELHDRARFEVTGMSLGPDDQSDVRRRLISAFDRFIDVRLQSDLEAARTLNELEIDIAIDLKGYTKDARPGILAHRPAPIQVSYLGYPGTMGAQFIDYVVGDPWVTPFDHQSYFTESIVQLPGSYQVNDSKRGISTDTPSRAECDLPEAAFVFCCFNQSAKLTPEIFAIWMRLLEAVDGSVLWLLRDNEFAIQNLRQEANRRGIDPGRLIFAPRMDPAQHLARHRLADLFLDTLPYNAHTTASDALWAGLPVLTCLGTTFAGRVAGSLLNAVGLPELITHSLQDYEVLALKLAADRERLAEMRARLQANIPACPLFDTNRFRKHLEAAYQTMWERWQRGDNPAGFAVTA